MSSELSSEQKQEALSHYQELVGSLPTAHRSLLTLLRCYQRMRDGMHR
jgi:hypothetical protein